MQFKNVQVNSVPILLAQLQPARRFGQGLYTMVQPACSLSFTAAFGWLINILINYWHWWTSAWNSFFVPRRGFVIIQVDLPAVFVVCHFAMFTRSYHDIMWSFPSTT